MRPQAQNESVARRYRDMTINMRRNALWLLRPTSLIDPAPDAYYLTHPVGARMNHDGHPGVVLLRL